MSFVKPVLKNGHLEKLLFFERPKSLLGQVTFVLSLAISVISPIVFSHFALRVMSDVMGVEKTKSADSNNHSDAV